MEIDIPPGTQPNQILKIKNQGFFNQNTKIRGNYYLKIIVELPRKVSQKQISLLNQFYK
ncbi:hypothetical protein DICPUDRAFT_93265 [Dictyostelium purpureum]|uniref:Chaperone DnaJ C-terminal domain-containing protein n=1 Tax=Dictyostelium purpureum TaxID=5786 RepID=F1A4U8_DICPU|nr:uncharacterized protein DICPUDRAFT_93265 [Dictyostelium purpureum]EGC28778.1 hypothetical protein DICPUDRAFT_93265 [Dictyostelium purpureum]|eukprot:XP_003294692.1 hypothetical protein DICPUDRAFT_93265 [Dictyostelium purpureum]